MIKNEKHSYAAKMLNRARQMFKAYQSDLVTAKQNLSEAMYSPYDKYLIRQYKMEISDYRWMMNNLTKEIQEWKEEIYTAQINYNNKIGKIWNGLNMIKKLFHQ